MTTNPLLLFLKETILRLTTKSPKYFQILQWIAGAVVLVIALPEALHYLGIDLSEALKGTLDKIVAIATKLSLLIPFLVSQSQTTAIDEQGNLLKQTDEKKLPFTAQAEGKQAQKMQINDLKVVREVTPEKE